MTWRLVPWRTGTVVRAVTTGLVAGLAFVAVDSTADAQTCTLPGGGQSPPSCYSANPADWPDPARPYFMLLVDTSGSMIGCTNPSDSAYQWPDSCPSSAPRNSCGLEPTRLNDAKCALRQTVQAFSGQVNFGLASFGVLLNGCSNVPCADSCTSSSGNCDPPDALGTEGEFYPGSSCTVTGLPTANPAYCGNEPDCISGAGPAAPPNFGEGTWFNAGSILVPLLQDPTPWGGTPPADNTGQILEYFDGQCNGSRELFAIGGTPIAGALQTVHQYIQAGWNQTWSSTNYCSSGFSYGADTALDQNDPLCRVVNVILVTDGSPSASCGYDTGTYGTNQAGAIDAAEAAAAAMWSGVSVPNGPTFNVRTHVIGFAGALMSAVQDIAAAGNGTALSANDESELAIALSNIIASAIRPEVCDNSDNNCNTCVDEGYQHFCNTGQSCCSWTTPQQRQNCITQFQASLATDPPDGDLTLIPCATPQQGDDCATWSCFNPGDICDDQDNNCDTEIDEGALKCNNHCPTSESCNGEDDDCDGIIDNAPGNSTPYSLPNCLPCVPTNELCDGCDNDCDGVADNGIAPINCGLPSPPHCSSTVSCGPPQAVAIGGCLPGAPVSRWGTCDITTQPEICDGIDNDCNGAIDDGIPPTPCEIPGQPGLVYTDTNPLSRCVKGQEPCNGQCAGWVGPTQEICDGFDNDCDGLVDDQDPDLVGVGLTCDGVCDKGITACVNGALVCQSSIQPQPEICDGLDNDCNGVIDDGQLLDAPSATEERCWDLPGTCCSFTGASGTTTWCTPPGATCNDLGALAGPQCRTGQLYCQAGGWVCLGPVGPDNEVCDGVDNDCNGTADDGIPPTTCGTDVGECQIGTQVCLNGQHVCQNAVGPQPEVCDGLDNDCDGVIDNGIAIGTPCTPDYDTTAYPGDRDTGLCRPGVTVCEPGGSLVCVGGTGPTPETCDGLDNDCDGEVDESGPQPDGINGTSNPNPPPDAFIGDECGTEVGACEKGNWGCIGGEFLCVGGVGPSRERCDCGDNDCDGAIDEDPEPGEPDLCTGDKLCVAYQNGCQCAGPCSGGEFPCPTGFSCETVDRSGTDPPQSVGTRCVLDGCGDCASETVSMPSGQVRCAPAGTVLPDGTTPPVCVCLENGCHEPCFHVTCDAPLVCTNYGTNAGKCVEDNCWNVPCTAGLVCNLGACVDNPCQADSCPANQVCKPDADFTAFTCTETCADVTCEQYQECNGGLCVPTGCPGPCTGGQVCGPNGICQDSLCTPDTCLDGSYCDPVTGACGNDPCAGVICPSGQQCDSGECIRADQPDAGPDAPIEGGAGAGGAAGQSGTDSGLAGGGGVGGSIVPTTPTAEPRGNWGLATGGGGCACEMGPGAGRMRAAAALAILALGFGIGRRRPAERRGRRTGR